MKNGIMTWFSIWKSIGMKCKTRHGSTKCYSICKNTATNLMATNLMATNLMATMAMITTIMVQEAMEEALVAWAGKLPSFFVLDVGA